MGYDIIVIIGFIIVIVILSIIWNHFVIKYYNKEKEKKSGFIFQNTDSYKLTLAGTGDDKNNDYEFSKAVKKINVSDDVKVRIDE